MHLFNDLVKEALKNQRELSPLKIVVEKELLHHDLLRILSHNNLLTNLTFIGGTALRTCYRGIRLSEDLDFTGGANFSKKSLEDLAQVITKNLKQKYGLTVVVSKPTKEATNVSTWKVKITTRPQEKQMPIQRINIDICSVPSYEKIPTMLINPYGVDMGTNGLIIQTQSREEIYTDKLLAFAFRPNRIKYRDLWDIIWLHQQGIIPRYQLLPCKLKDRNLTMKSFLDLYEQRAKLLATDPNLEAEFKREMERFLPIEKIDETIKQDNFWPFLLHLVNDLKNQIDTNQI